MRTINIHQAKTHLSRLVDEAEQFVRRMRPMEPDQMFSIEAIEAKQVWN